MRAPALGLATAARWGRASQSWGSWAADRFAGPRRLLRRLRRRRQVAGPRQQRRAFVRRQGHHTERPQASCETPLGP
eukprot:15464051-Alexandrium_andersonii.AAC.1